MRQYWRTMASWCSDRRQLFAASGNSWRGCLALNGNPPLGLKREPGPSTTPAHWTHRHIHHTHHTQDEKPAPTTVERHSNSGFQGWGFCGVHVSEANGSKAPAQALHTVAPLHRSPTARRQRHPSISPTRPRPPPSPAAPPLPAPRRTTAGGRGRRRRRSRGNGFTE